MYSSGDVVAVTLKLGEGEEKTRLALVLYEEFGNVVVAGITANPYAKGIPIYKKEGGVRDSTIKLNYVFTVSEDVLSRPFFRLKQEKRKMVLDQLLKLLSGMQD